MRYGERDQAKVQRPWMFLALISMARLIAAWAIPLTEDEAYYRLWAQSLQFGYYDHPPMIAWWIRLGTMLAGDDPLGVRLAPVLATAATSWVVFDIARRLGAGTATAERAAIWYNATLLVAVGGQMATPDAPATLFWALALWCALRAWEHPRWWLAAGAAAGLGCLSKYSALFLGPGMLLWLVSSADGRTRLKTPWPWSAVVIAAAIFSVNIVWNAEHHWLSFAKQFGRVAPSGLALQHLPGLFLSQFLLLNPLIALYAADGLAKAWRGRAANPGANLFMLLATGAPFAAYLVLHALHDRVQAHWPAPLYPGLAICAAFAAGPVRLGGRMRRIQWGAPAFGLGLGGLALVHLALPQTDLFSGDPAASLRGWPSFAAELNAVARQQHAAWVGTVSYGLAAQLDDQPALGVPVIQLAERNRYGPADRSWTVEPGRAGLVLDLTRRLELSDLTACFEHAEPLGFLKRGEDETRSRYALFRVQGAKRDLLNQGCWSSKDRGE